MRFLPANWRTANWKNEEPMAEKQRSSDWVELASTLVRTRESLRSVVLARLDRVRELCGEPEVRAHIDELRSIVGGEACRLTAALKDRAHRGRGATC